MDVVLLFAFDLEVCIHFSLTVEDKFVMGAHSADYCGDFLKVALYFIFGADSILQPGLTLIFKLKTLITKL